ncbi:protein tesmin/TSO1-like CXC 2 isoform X2 [Hevea brasiliensis]|uniref:protein tesmin/TSO1-like CXC 2 isoform X2 n=1 Tax=Hevea brasiliensis TaxID=3981 RepID=UPI0025F2CAA1|nr:protein tesmin/TSO1-like CXC 2 isoform X2 [Hevea brasiliensis]
MDTPEKTQITTSLSKFEDSPIFNYINSLSPIKPVKSVHITQALHSLSFGSLPSIFTSPHLSSNKESRFLRRHHYSDPSKSEFSSENGNKVSRDEGTALDVAQLYDNSAELQENFNPGASIGEVSVEPPTEDLRFAVELPRRLNYGCGSPEYDPTPRCGPQIDCSSELAGISRKCSPEREMHLQRVYQAEQKKEATDCDWESLISDSNDLLIFNSPTDTEAFKGLMQKSLDLGTSFSASLGEVHKVQIGPSTQPGETIVPKEINQKRDNLADNGNPNECTTSNPNEDVDNEVGMSAGAVSKAVSILHRGIRRRCLDFETAAARRKNLGDSSNLTTSVGGQSDEKIASIDKRFVPFKPGSDSSRCVLPGIGLHLNALAITSKDSKNVKHETLSSGISVPSTVAPFPSQNSGQELNESLSLASTDIDIDPTENEAPFVEDVPQASACLVTEEFNHSSAKKKRRKLEGESEACKRCNCKKSKCLKLYCECFAAGVYCIEPCSCQECFNKPIHEDTVLSTRKQIESRNPLAFAPKVIRSSETATEDESSKTPASARHKRGCNCKKSSCLKKYCECYQGGVGCSINCRCEGCKNAFGRKDGSAPAEIEAEAETEDETEGHEKSGVDKISQKTEIQNNEEQNPNSALPMTPLAFCRARQLLQPPFSSKSKPPRSFLSIGSSSGLYTSQKYGKPNILRPQPKFETQVQTIHDDDMPEILRGNYSPSNGIKTSPNSKRVSPPHSILGSSPAQRSGRKLILQSIPSFPSLTPQH